jgi:general secretion pathway protein I
VSSVHDRHQRSGTRSSDVRGRLAAAAARGRTFGDAGGFTLLEVIVALAILGIGLGVVFQGIGQGLRLRGAAAESVRLALAAEAVLGRLPERTAAPAAPEEGEDAGCRWRLEAVSGAAGAGGAGSAKGSAPAQPVEVRLTVTAPSGAAWTLTTLLPPPEEAKP